MLLTGASGFLGQLLFQYLEKQYDIFLANHKNPNCRLDIRHLIKLELDEKMDIVVHSAGKAHSVPRTAMEEKEFYDTNFEGTKNLCRALEGMGTLPKRFIFISTVAVYGLDEGQGIDEAYPLNGKTPYANSKILAESWLQSWADDNNVTLGILRLPLIAGPNPPGNLGTMIRSINSGIYFSVGGANPCKSIVWGEDIAHIIPALSEKGGIYNLTDGYHPTFKELEAAIASALNKRTPANLPYWVAKVMAKTGDVLGGRFPINSDKLRKITSPLTFDDQKAITELGWSPTPVLSKIDEII